MAVAVRGFHERTLDLKYPALAQHIARLRAAGVSESIIEDSVERQLREAEGQGYTRQQVETVARQGLRHPMPVYSPGAIGGMGDREAFAAFQQEMASLGGPPPEPPGLLSAFGRGMLRGLTLGYAGEYTPEHPLATIAGEILGGIVPGAALFAAAAPVGGITAGLVGASRFAPLAARFGPVAARLGLGQTGAAGIGALAREAATGAAFGGLWNPEEGGMGQRVESAAIGAVTAPPLALALRGLGAGLGAAKRRLFPGTETPSVPGQLALPPGAYAMPPSSEAVPGAARPVRWPERYVRGMEAYDEALRGILPRPGQRALPSARFEMEGQTTTQPWFPPERPIPRAGGFSPEPPPSPPGVPRGTPPGPLPGGPTGEGRPGPPPRRTGRGGPKVPVITASGQRVMRPVESLGLEDLASIEGVKVELRGAGETAGFTIRARPDGQVEAVGRGGTLDIFPDEAAAGKFVQGATQSGGAALKQPVEQTTSGGTSTLDKAMRGAALGVDDQANLQRQRLANASGKDPFAAEIADPARVEGSPSWEVVPDLPKGQVRVLTGIRTRGDLAQAQAAVERAGYKFTLAQVPARTGPGGFDLYYYFAKSPSITKAIGLQRQVRSLIVPSGKLSAENQQFVGRMFGKTEAEIAAEMAAAKAPGPSATAGKAEIGQIRKTPTFRPGQVASEEERRIAAETMAKLKAERESTKDLLREAKAGGNITAEQERELIASMETRAAAEEAGTDFPFGAAEGRLHGRTVKRRGAGPDFTKSDREAVRMMTTRAPEDASADFLVETSPGIARRLGLRKGMTIGEVRQAAGLDVKAGLTPEQTRRQLRDLGDQAMARLAPGEGIPRVQAGESAPSRWRFAMPWVQPQQSQNPFIAQLGFEGKKAESSAVDQLKKWGDWGRERIVGAVGGAGTPSDARAFKMVQGEIPLAKATPQERIAVESWREAMRDFAQRLGTPDWLNYVTHVTDFETIYQALRGHFAGKVTLADLDTKVAFRVGSPARFEHFRKVFQGFPDWERLPRTVKTELKELWKFNTIADTWDSLPEFLQQQLPKAVFDRYLLPRIGEAPYKESLVAAWQHYVPIAVKKIEFDPLLAKWNKILTELPGPDLPLTEKRYMRTYLEGRILGRPTQTDQMLGYLTDRINLALGKPLLNVDQIHAGVTLFRSGFYRGSLGIDSALTNTTQVLNNWAQNGKVVGPLFKHISAFSDLRQRGLVGQFVDLTTEDFPARMRSGVMEKVLRWDQALTRAVLSPMSITEYANRGAAFAVGMEEAAARGLSPKAMLVNAYAKASSLVPPLELSEQIQHALFKVVPQTQFGMSSAEMAPMFRGVLGRVSSLLVTYPTQQAAFEIRGLVQSSKAMAQHLQGKSLSEGFAEAVAAGDAGRLVRFMALTGGFTALPYIMYEVFGYGVNDSWGMKSVLDLTMNPFWRMIRNGYAALMGYTLADRDEARQELTDFFKTLTRPQYRWGKKAADVIEGISRGYAVDTKARYLYNTTPWGELMRLAGVAPPERAQAQHLARRLMMDSYEHRRDKRGAIDAILEGDLDAATSFSKRWNEAIRPEDVLRVQQERMRPVPQQFGRGLPVGLRQQAVGEELR